MRSKLLIPGAIVAALTTLPLPAWGELRVGEIPKAIKLGGDIGGRVTGEPWSSDEIKGKIFVLFYVDPDEKDLNDPTAKALKKEEFPRDKFASIAIINMAASWAPNFIIQANLEAKQKEFPDTIYVRDKKKVVVNEWKLRDDSSNVVLFDKTGKVLFSRDGKLSDEDTAKLVELVKQNI